MATSEDCLDPFTAYLACFQPKRGTNGRLGDWLGGLICCISSLVTVPDDSDFARMNAPVRTETIASIGGSRPRAVIRASP